jgi:hypothetical protein
MSSLWQLCAVVVVTRGYYSEDLWAMKGSLGRAGLPELQSKTAPFDGAYKTGVFEAVGKRKTSAGKKAHFATVYQVPKPTSPVSAGGLNGSAQH